MLKKLTAALMACCLILSMAPYGGEAWAAGLSEPCSVTVEAGAELMEDLVDAGVVIDLYQIAAASEESESGYSLSILAPYTELADHSAADGVTWQTMAQRAAQIAFEEGAPVVTGAPVGQTITETNGGAPLGAGLYLLIARGEAIDAYYDLVEDENGGEVLVTYAQSEDYDYTFAPELISLPSIRAESEDEEGVWPPQLSGAEESVWVYHVTVALKMARRARYGDLEIVKRLLTYDASEPATFVFDIKAELGGAVVYSNVAAITFTAPGTRAVLVERIPVGAEVTVTEVYSGTRYAVVGASERTAVIGARTAASVEFENDYVGTPKGGHGITNNFTYDGETWIWVPFEG